MRSFPSPLRFQWLPRHMLVEADLTCNDTDHAPAKVCPKFTVFQRCCESLTLITFAAHEFTIKFFLFFLDCRTAVILCLSSQRSSWTNRLTYLGCFRPVLPFHFSIVSIIVRSLGYDCLYSSDYLGNVRFQLLLHLNSFRGYLQSPRLFLQNLSDLLNS